RIAMKWLQRAAVAVLACCAMAGSALAQALTPEIIAAAEKEGTVTWYTASEITTAQSMVKAFETRYPKIKVVLERNGGERIFQRIGQEYSAGIYNADVVTSSEMGHAVLWKKQGWLAKYVPEDVEKYWP